MKSLSAKSYRVLMYDNRNEYRRVIARLTELMTVGRGNTHVANNRGVAQLETGNLAAAIEDFKTALRESGTNATACVNLAYALEKTGDLDAALVYFSLAISLEPLDATLRRCRAGLYVRMNSPHKAAADYTAAIQLEPGFKQTFRDRAEIYDQIGELELARQDRAIADGPIDHTK